MWFHMPPPMREKASTSLGQHEFKYQTPFILSRYKSMRNRPLVLLNF